MANVKFELNRDGLFELMKSSEMMAVCMDYANKALGALGDGYEVNNLVGQNRVNAEIEAVSYQAKVENSENNTILKALRG